MFYRGGYGNVGDGREMGPNRQRVIDQGYPFYGTTPGSSFMCNPAPCSYVGQPPPFPVVRLLGLPFDCSEADIAVFFHGIDVVDVLFVKKNDKFTGEAYCLLAYPLQVGLALQRNRQNIGRRYVQVFRSRRQEYYKAIANEVSGSRGGSPHQSACRAKFSERGSAEHTRVLRLERLPFSAGKDDIMGIFKSFVLSEDSIHITANSEGRPTGEAFVEFASAEDSKAAMAKYRRKLEKLHIELFPSPHEDLDAAVSGGREESSNFSPQYEKMANDTQSSHESKDDESNSSRKKAIVSKGSSSSGSATTDISSLSSSTRETPLQKQISSSTSIASKSEQLEKRTPPATPVKMKSEKGSGSPSISLGSKKSEKESGSSDVKRKKLKRERSVEQLILEAREISRREKQDPKPVGVKKKRMNACTYKSLFKKQRKKDTAPDIDEDLERPNKLSQVDSSCCGVSISKQMEDGEDGGEKCWENMGEELREEFTEGACEGGTQELVKEALQGECSKSSADTEDQNVLQQVQVPPLHPTDARPTDLTNQEAVVIEQAELQLSPSTDSPVDQNQPNSGSASGVEQPPCSEGHITSLNTEAPQQFENPTEPSNQAVLQLGAYLEPPPPIYAIDAPASGNQKVLQQVEVRPLHPTNAGPTDQTNREAVVIEHAEQLQLSPSTDSPVDQNQPKSGSASGVEQPLHSEGHITSLNAEAPQQFENQTEPSNQAVFQPGENLSPSPPIHNIDAPASGNQNAPKQVEVPPLHPTDSVQTNQTNHEAVVIEHASPSTVSPNQNQPNSGSASGVEQQPRCEGHIPSLNTEAPQQFEDLPEPSNQVVLQPGANLAPYPQIKAIDVPASRNQNVLQQVGIPPFLSLDAGPTDQTDHEAVVIEHAEQPQLLPSTDSPVDQNQPISGSPSGVEQPPRSEGHITSMNAEALQRFENQTKPSDLAVLQAGENMSPPPPIHVIDAPASGNQNVLRQVEVPPLHPTDAGPTDQTNHEVVLIEHDEQLQLSPSTDSADQNQPNAGSASGVEQPHSEGHIPSLNAESSQQFEDPPKPSNLTVLQSGANLAPSPQIKVIDVPASGNQNVLQQVGVPPLLPTDAGPTDQTDLEAVVIEHAEQLQLSPSTDSPVHQNQPKSGSASEGELPPCNEGHITSLNVEAPQQFENQTEPSDLAVLQAGENLSPPPPIHVIDAPASGNQHVLHQVEVPPLHPTDAGPTDQTNHETVVIKHAKQLQLSPSTDSPDQNQSNSGSASGVEQPPCCEGNISSLNAEAPQQFVDPSNQAVLQPGANLAPSFLIKAIDVPGSGNQNVLQQVEVPPLLPTDAGPARPTDQTDHEAMVIGHAEQLQLSPSTNSPVDQNQPNSGSSSSVERRPYSEGHITSLNVEAPQQFENPAETSDLAVLQAGDLALPPPVHATDVPLAQNQRDLHLANRNDRQPSSEGCTFFQSAEASTQLVEDMAGNPNHVPGTQLRMQPPIDTLGTHLPLNSAQQVASQMPTQPLFADPLQNELERLHKQTEQSIKVYEDMKLRLKSDCEKEIEEVRAQIRRVYEAKIEEAEAAFLLKKKELDTNHNKVLMNNALAEAFRSKYLDLRPSGAALGMQQVGTSNFMQQLHLLSSQPAPRPSHVIGSSSVVPAAASQQTTPPAQVVHPSSVLLSRMPTRPPHIVTITHPTGNFQANGQVRAPAPHLRPFRPSSSMSATPIASLPRGFPSQQAPRILPTTPALPVIPPRPTPPPQPRNHSGHYDRSPQPEGGLPSLQNSFLSTLGLLVDVEKQPGAHTQNILPPLPDLGSVLASLNLSQSGAPGSGSVNLACSGVATDIVCLSDDD